MEQSRQKLANEIAYMKNSNIDTVFKIKYSKIVTYSTLFTRILFVQRAVLRKHMEDATG